MEDSDARNTLYLGSASDWIIPFLRLGWGRRFPLTRGEEHPRLSSCFLSPSGLGGWEGGAEQSLSPPSGKKEG